MTMPAKKIVNKATGEISVIDFRKGKKTQEETLPGVIRVISKKDRNYYDVVDVMELLGVSDSCAYKIMRQLREELIAEGKIIDNYPKGKVPKKYFDARCGID